MYWLTSQIIPSLQVLKILTDIDSFQSWMHDTHSDKNIDELFDGYQFAISCCLNSFVDGICNYQVLGIENDFLFERALAQSIPLKQIETSCEKTIFLENLKPILKPVLKTKSYLDLNEKLRVFEKKVTSKFDAIKKNNLLLSKGNKLNLEIANQLWLIDYTHTHLFQINNNGPAANETHPLSNEWTSSNRLKHYFEGYKYAIQFLWYKLLGPEKLNKTHLKKIHLADSWRDYKYINYKNSDNSILNIFNREYDVNEQSSFDSYFYWVQNEITDPLKEKYGFNIHTIDDQFQFNPEGYHKQDLFGDLLNKENITKVYPKMGWSDQIKERLYWYPLEIINTRELQMHVGISSFNTMLAGTVTLHKSNESEFSKIVVSKFIHPLPKRKNANDYSYGILIDAKSSAGHYSSGWLIYKNACGDHTGFSGREHKSSEKLISQYLKEGKIELRELIVPLKEFTKFTSEYTKSEKELSILDQNKLIPDIIQKSRAQLLEFLTYYVCSKSNIYKGCDVRLNVDQNNSQKGEKDVVIINDDEVILIECKLNPQNYNMEELIEKLYQKVNTFSQTHKSCQIWCWEELSVKNKKILDQSRQSKIPITYVEVSNPNKHTILRGVSLKQMRHIMKDYFI